MHPDFQLINIAHFFEKNEGYTPIYLIEPWIYCIFKIHSTNLQMTAGYSSTPLAKKLGIKSAYKVLLVNEPNHYHTLFSDWPELVEQIESPKPESLDFIHIFCHEANDLKAAAQQIPFLKKSGILWVSWVKLSSKLPSPFRENHIRDYMLDAGLVDVKVAAIDTDWSGLKFMYRLRDR